MNSVPHVGDDDLVIQASDMALVSVASLHASGNIDLSPRFQRRDRWDRARQSQLIESFIVNVPVPPVYLAEEERGIFAVIDGKQRLTAISQFFAGDFKLVGLQLRPDLEGLTYSELPPKLSAAFNMRPLRAITILRQTPDWVKHEVFVRLNRGGQPLNAQEIRNVAFAGPLNDKILELSSDDFLHKQMKIISEGSRSYADMSDVELVVRFFALAEGWQRFSGNLSSALDHFMIRNHDSSPRKIEEYGFRFRRALYTCKDLWGPLSFRRFDGYQWRDQMIGGVFDAQMVAIDMLSDDQLARLVGKSKAVISATSRLFADTDFDASVRLSTNTTARVRRRIESMYEVLAELAA